MNASSFHYSWHLLFYILCKMWEALPQVISLNWIWVNISHTLKRSLYHNLFFIYFFTTEINKISLRILKKIRIFRPSWQFCDSYYFFFSLLLFETYNKNFLSVMYFLQDFIPGQGLRKINSKFNVTWISNSYLLGPSLRYNI